ncbi:MAG: hypothetical protein ABI602_02685 [Candidatus Saccharibacteria bacterium]
MSELPSNGEIKQATSDSEKAWLGKITGEILRHAASKQTQVDILAESIDCLVLPDRQTKSGKYALEDYQNLSTELDYQKNKLDWRARSAQNLLAANLELRLTNTENGQMVAQGILSAIDLKKATLRLDQNEGDPVEVAYAVNLPVPDNLDQTYFGHVLAVDFEVLSVQPEKSWVLR